MNFTPEKAAIRFGEGLSPKLPSPGSEDGVLAQLDGPDMAAASYPIHTLEDLWPDLRELADRRRAARRGRNGPGAEALDRAFRDIYRPHRQDLDRNFARMAARTITTSAPFRERLARFWADHFTVIGKQLLFRGLEPAFCEAAIRPHLSGRFSDMLKAAILHPLMLNYLDQTSSVGPNAPAARGRRGMNENLAREVLELHTLGVGASYTQADVQQLSELFTGLTVSAQDGFRFRADRAEPGAEHVLGQSYGGGPPVLADIERVLDDLATHPDTAEHICRKLAMHFISDHPDEAIVAEMSAVFEASGGALRPVYKVMVHHPLSWESFGQKVKQPVDFVFSALRALAVPPRSLGRMSRRNTRAVFLGPLASMGQPWLSPAGPDGWPEDAEAWVTVQGIAARLQWSIAAPAAIFRALPDPRDFAQTALGGLSGPKVRFAAEKSENRREGLGLILASPAFQRR